MPRQIAFNTQEAAAVSKEIDKLLDKKVIRSVKPCFNCICAAQTGWKFLNDP